MMIFYIIKIFLLFTFLFSSTLYFEADPFQLFYYENEQFNIKEDYLDLNIRPTLSTNFDNHSDFYFNTWYYYNDNAPNLENNSNKWVGKGNNLFHSLHF